MAAEADKKAEAEPVAEAESMAADVVQEVEAGHLAKDVAEASDKTVAQDRALLLEAKEDAAESAKKAELESLAAEERTSPGGEPPPAAGWGIGGAGQVP